MNLLLIQKQIVNQVNKKRLTKRDREAQNRKLMAKLYDLKKQLKKAKLKKDIKALEVQIRKLNRKLKIKTSLRDRWSRFQSK